MDASPDLRIFMPCESKDYREGDGKGGLENNVCEI